MLRLPRLQVQPDSESRDNNDGVPDAQLPGLGRLSVIQNGGHVPKRMPSDPVLQERYNSASLANERDSPSWPRKRKSSATDPFGRNEYDGPILRNGPIGGCGDPAPVAYPVLHSRSEATDKNTACTFDHNSADSMPSMKKRKGTMRSESPGMVVPSGRRVSSRAAFKTPFRKGLDPLAPPPRVTVEQTHTLERTHDDHDEKDIGASCTASASEMSDSDAEGQSRNRHVKVNLKWLWVQISNSTLPPRCHPRLASC